MVYSGWTEMTTRPCTKLFTIGLCIFMIGVILNKHTELLLHSQIILGIGVSLFIPGMVMTMVEVERAV